MLDECTSYSTYTCRGCGSTIGSSPNKAWVCLYLCDNCFEEIKNEDAYKLFLFFEIEAGLSSLGCTAERLVKLCDSTTYKTQEIINDYLL